MEDDYIASSKRLPDWHMLKLHNVTLSQQIMVQRTKNKVLNDLWEGRQAKAKVEINSLPSIVEFSSNLVHCLYNKKCNCRIQLRTSHLKKFERNEQVNYIVSKYYFYSEGKIQGLMTQPVKRSAMNTRMRELCSSAVFHDKALMKKYIKKWCWCCL